MKLIKRHPLKSHDKKAPDSPEGSVFRNRRSTPRLETQMGLDEYPYIYKKKKDKRPDRNSPIEKEPRNFDDNEELFIHQRLIDRLKNENFVLKIQVSELKKMLNKHPEEEVTFSEYLDCNVQDRAHA